MNSKFDHIYDIYFNEFKIRFQYKLSENHIEQSDSELPMIRNCPSNCTCLFANAQLAVRIVRIVKWSAHLLKELLHLVQRQLTWFHSPWLRGHSHKGAGVGLRMVRPEVFVSACHFLCYEREVSCGL